MFSNKGTNRNSPNSSLLNPVAETRVKTVIIWLSHPTGITNLAPILNCASNGFGTKGAPAVTTIPSKGASTLSPL